MPLSTTTLNNIPCNVITGFLGVGKSTAIQHLLANKPDNERWAVLVNEFGEVGIDGSLLQADAGRGDSVVIREVPGGCMCCAAGVPMHIALNSLLKQARPDRLLIEPTGLGHPAEVLAILKSEHYRDVLDLRATLTLVDARKVAESRYTSHDIFNEQLDIADIIVANKADQYEPGDLDALKRYLAARSAAAAAMIVSVHFAQLDIDWLETPAGTHTLPAWTGPEAEQETLPVAEGIQFPESGFITIRNRGEGFFSQGWVFTPTQVFDRHQLARLFQSQELERLKGMFITSEGIFVYNLADGILREMPVDEAFDSRVEIIQAQEASSAAFERELLACRIA